MIKKRILLIMPTTTYRAAAFMEAAAQQGLEIVVASERQQALAPLAGGSTLVISLTDAARTIAVVKKAATEKPFHAIIGVDEESVLLAAMVSAALDLPHNSIEAVRAARNKHLMRQKFQQAGLPTPQFRLFKTTDDPHNLAGHLKFPCVLKPTFLSASRGVIRADNPTEFNAAFARIGQILNDRTLTSRIEAAPDQILCEDYLPGVEVSVEGMLLDGEFRQLALFDKPDPLEGPFFAETIYVTPSRLATGLQQAIFETTGRAALALGLRTGPIHAELRLNETGIYPLEVAARSIGGLCSRVLRFAGGVSLEEIILQQAVGGSIADVACENRAAGVMMIPVPQAGTLQEVSGQDAAHKIPGVEAVMMTAPPGTAVQALPESGAYLGFIFARGDFPDRVEDVLRQAYAALQINIVPPAKI